MQIEWMKKYETIWIQMGLVIPSLLHRIKKTGRDIISKGVTTSRHPPHNHCLCCLIS
jgi:hypothetical protein